MRSMQYAIVWFLSLWVSLAAAQAQAGAHQVVEETTQRVMDVIRDAQGYYDQEPERFYHEIEVVLGEIIDFKSFARSVMGVHGSKKRYMALSNADQKAQFRSRIDRFSEVFKDGLVKTYAKGLLAFNGNKVEVLPPKAGESVAGSSVTVVQHIYGDAERPYEVRYKLRQNRSGDWKLRNVTIETINLGKTYKSQFDSEMKLRGGDIDTVIDSWTVDPSSDAPASAG